MAKLYSHATELSSIRLLPMYIQKDEELAGTEAWHLLSPHTESLRGIMHIEVRCIPQVDTHVNGIPNPSSILQNSNTLAKRNPRLSNSLAMCNCACGVSVVVINVAVVRRVLVAAAVRFRPTLVVRDSHTVHRLKQQQTRVLSHVPDDSVCLGEATTPSFQQVHNHLAKGALRNLPVCSKRNRASPVKQNARSDCMHCPHVLTLLRPCTPLGPRLQKKPHVVGSDVVKEAEQIPSPLIFVTFQAITTNWWFLVPPALSVSTMILTKWVSIG